MKLARIILLLFILWTAVYSGWFVYGIVFELLDFQIWAYRVMLQAGEQLWAVRDAVWWAIEQAIWLFGWEWWAEQLSDNETKSIEKKLAFFEWRLKLISGIIGLLAGLLVWKILSDIVFGLKNTIQRVTSFVK